MRRYAVLVVTAIAAAQAIAVVYVSAFVADATSQAATVFGAVVTHGGVVFGALLGLFTWAMGLQALVPILVGGGVLAWIARRLRTASPIDGTGRATTVIVAAQMIGLAGWFAFVPVVLPTGVWNSHGTGYGVLVAFTALLWFTLDAMILWRAISGKPFELPSTDVERLHADALVKSRELARAEIERSRAEVREKAARS